jgi:hypothetical protein
MLSTSWGSLRACASQLSPKNKPGEEGAIGAEIVARLPPREGNEFGGFIEIDPVTGKAFSENCSRLTIEAFADLCVFSETLITGIL